MSSVKRTDGRVKNIREHLFGLDVLQQADGSARLVARKVEILASVVGPTAAKSRQEKADRAVLQVSVQTLSSSPSIQPISYNCT